MLEFHRDRRAAVTIAVTLVPPEETSQYGMLELDSRGRVLGFEEKPAGPARSQLASMGVYAFRRDALWQALEVDAEDESSSHDFGRDVIPALLAQGADVYGYLFPQYWQDVGTIDAFYAANLDLLSDRPQIDLSIRIG